MNTREFLAELHGDGLLFLDPEGTYDRAIIGVVERACSPPAVCYDRELVLRALVEVEGMTEEDAIEWFDVNTAGAWVGDQTPVFLSRTPIDDGPSDEQWLAALGPCGK